MQGVHHSAQKVRIITSEPESARPIFKRRSETTACCWSVKGWGASVMVRSGVWRRVVWLGLGRTNITPIKTNRISNPPSLMINL